MKQVYLRGIALFLLLVAVVLALGVVTLAQPATMEASAVAPTPAAPGFYLVGSKNLDPALFYQAGDMQFFAWSQLQPGENEFNWSLIDNFINSRSSAGKQAAIALTTYDARAGLGARQMPAWARSLPNATIPGELTEQVRNGGFESGPLDSWSSAGPVSADGNAPYAGVYAAQLGGSVSSTAELSQANIRIPCVLAQGQLSYWWRMETSENGGAAKDILTVDLLEGSSVVVQVHSVSNTAGNTGWAQRTFSLIPYDCHTATLRFRLTNDSVNPTTVIIDAVSLTVQPVLPKFWDAAYQQPYQAFVQALGDRYRNDPRLEFVALGTGVYGETRASDTVDKPVTAANGLDSTVWVNAVNAITDMYVAAFSEAGQLRKPLLLQMAPFQFNAWERRDFSAYAAGQGVGLSFNSLYWDWNYAETGDYASNSVRGTAAYDPLTAHGATVPVAFETYGYMLGNDPAAERFYWGILNGLDKHPAYIRLADYSGWYLGPGDTPVPAYTSIMQWAAPYIGASLRTTPSVWTALREHIVPTYYHYSNSYENSSYYPPLGNFEFWLYQRDSVPGGRTVPETYLSSLNGQAPQMGLCPPTPNGPPSYPCRSNAYNPTLPAVREALTIRRTDQASANPWMFFDVDDGYIAGQTNGIALTITYWDHGVDRFRLLYDAASGPRYAAPEGTAATWVQKQGSDQFRTVTFQIDDARFANGLSGGADFAIDARDENGIGDGDEWIHFVDVRKRFVRSTQVVPAGDPVPLAFPGTDVMLDFSASPGGQVTVTMHMDDHPQAPEGVNALSRSWQMETDMAGGFVVDVQFTYRQRDLPGVEESEIGGAARWDAGQVRWQYLGGSVDTVADTLTVPGVSRFSDWVLIGASPPQAVTGLAISRSGNTAQLTWQPVTQDIAGRPATIVAYRIYRAANSPYFQTAAGVLLGAVSSVSYADPDAVGDAGVNYTYLVTAVDSNGWESSPSLRKGEFDFALQGGSAP